MPVFNRTYVADQEVEGVIKEALIAKFNLPLVAVTGKFSLLTDPEIEALLPANLINHSRQGRLTEETMRQIAAKLPADMVIGAEITRFTSQTYNNLQGDLLQKTYLEIRVTGYNDRDKKCYVRTAYRDYDGDWAVAGDADYLAREIMNDLLSKFNYGYGTLTVAGR